MNYLLDVMLQIFL